MNRGVSFPELKGRLGFGCLRLPMNGENVDYEELIRMADAFLDAGFNYFDTAHGLSTVFRRPHSGTAWQ